jgi:uncharacterized protein Yka (UPF0111/DUF47 family)
MKLNKLLTLFAPKDRVFYGLFEKDADNMLLAAKTLNELFAEGGNGRRTELIAEIERLERAGDTITQDIFDQLSVNFITPFDREDIHDLAIAMDDVVDFIRIAGLRLKITDIQTISAPMRKLANLIEASAIEVHKAVSELRHLDYKVISAMLSDIHHIKSEAETAFGEGITDLFANEPNAITVIKYQEVLELLENAADKCEEVANVINSIILKYA